MIPNQFFETSRRLGISPVFVQGAGGNISWKENGTMYVKASGFFLKNIKRGEGYVSCRLRPLTMYLNKIRYVPRSMQQEEAFNALIEKHLFLDESFGVPSIETGMHAVLGRAVIHTHNVYANAIGCMDGGEKILAKLFKDSISIPYVNPGLALAHTLALRKKKSALPPTIFLLNHGLITHADTFRDALRHTLAVNSVLEKYLRDKRMPLFRVGKKPYRFTRHLFPDSVVYSQIDFKKLNAEKKRVFYEISSMSRYITGAIVKLRGGLRFISAVDVYFIKNMGKEKHRIAMLRRG